MTNKIAVAVLIHDDVDRADTLLRTITSLVRNTEIYEAPLPVYIYVNGTNPNIEVVLDILTRAFSWECEFFIERSEKNLGCSYGVNALNKMVEQYKYVLFLEGDWVCLDDTDRNWLEQCISYLDEHSEIAQIYLRRFCSSLEVRQFYGLDWFYNNSDETIKVSEKIRMYTNNPVLRRNSSFYELGVLPFEIVENETKENPNWGLAEIKNEQRFNINSAIYKQGIFQHIESRNFDVVSANGRSMSFQPTPRKPMPCEKCKFGFYQLEEPLFCKICQSHPYSTYEDLDNLFVIESQKTTKQ